MYKVIPIQKNGLDGISEADILEIWFDRIKGKSREIFLKDLKKFKKPIIYKVEKFNEANIDNQKEVIKLCEYIDIDVKTDKKLIKRIKDINPKIKIISSYHDFKKTPYEKDLKKILGEMMKLKPNIVKFATKAEKIGDSFRMLDFLQFLNKKDITAICLCMGKCGLLTRVTGELFGNYLMYFAKDSKSKSAPGQITIKEYKKFTNES